MPQAKLDVLLRTFQWDDLPALHTLINLISTHDGDTSQIDIDTLKHDFEAPYFHPLTDVFVVEDSEGQLLGFCHVEFDLDNQRAFIGGGVHPAQRRQGLGTQLMRTVGARVQEQLKADLPAGTPVNVKCGVMLPNPGAQALLDQEGYELKRYIHRMNIDFAEAIDDVPPPAGLEFRPFDAEQHTPALYQAQQESFADHWGFAPTSLADWEYDLIKGSYYEPELFLVAWDGEQIAGYSICSRDHHNIPNKGYVWILGVRKPWRRRGLGYALLRHSFHVLQAHGFTSVGLTVDAENTTNAVALYERAGMSLTRRRAVYTKDVR